MDYECPVNELEQQLKEAGEQLALSHSSTKDLLDLLDKTEQLLTFVGQAPSPNMQGALVPSMGALISDELLKNSDEDVKVSVASCLCEVARITAPEAPYKDDIMKEIFQLNVMAFGELSNVTGRSYYKAVHILESVAKVKSCLLMLDLECDALILEMFEQFLSRIRTTHPQPVFKDMESIMTLVIEESDEIASQLLSLLISHVRKENQNVSPAPWKLAEKVLRNCYETLKPYSSTLLELIEADADEYAEIVVTLCQKDQENELLVTKPTKTSNKRDANTLMHSNPKKHKPTDTQKGAAMTKKIEDYNKNEIKGKKDLEASKNLSHSSKGRPRNQKNNLSQDSKEDLRKTRFQDKSSNSGGLSSKGKKGTSGKPQQHLASYSVVKETETDGYQNKVFKYGKHLVGRRIRVWWPLDKTYYEGAVSSYNPLDNKHKVLYADGDEEVLDLRLEKWCMLDELPPDDQPEEADDLPSPMTTSTKRLKKKGNRKPESSPMQEGNSNSPKSPSLKVQSAKEDDIKDPKNSRNEVVEINEASLGLKSTVKTIEKMETEVEEESKEKTERLEENQQKELVKDC